eukprot:jgi/Chlat1/1869/Chrsp141S02181
MPICPNGHHNPDGAQFCSECGTPVTAPQQAGGERGYGQPPQGYPPPPEGYPPPGGPVPGYPPPPPGYPAYGPQGYPPPQMMQGPPIVVMQDTCQHDFVTNPTCLSVLGCILLFPFGLIFLCLPPPCTETRCNKCGRQLV